MELVEKKFEQRTVLQLLQCWLFRLSQTDDATCSNTLVECECCQVGRYLIALRANCSELHVFKYVHDPGGLWRTSDLLCKENGILHQQHLESSLREFDLRDVERCIMAMCVGFVAAEECILLREQIDLRPMGNTI